VGKAHTKSVKPNFTKDSKAIFCKIFNVRWAIQFPSLAVAFS
jgi:hypothetical protein